MGGSSELKQRDALLKELGPDPRFSAYLSTIPLERQITCLAFVIAFSREAAESRPEETIH